MSARLHAVREHLLSTRGSVRLVRVARGWKSTTLPRHRTLAPCVRPSRHATARAPGPYSTNSPFVVYLSAGRSCCTWESAAHRGERRNAGNAVRRVHQDATLPVRNREQGRLDVPPHDRQDDKVLVGRLLRCPGRNAGAELFQQRCERFRPARVAQSPIRTFQFLESHQEEKHWSSRSGESTVKKTSIDPSLVQPEVDEVSLKKAGVAIPFAGLDISF